MSGTSVLIVDDHPLVADMLAAELASLDWDVSTTYDPDEAAEIARSSEPSLVVLDIDLKKVSGFDVAHAVRAVSPATKIVMFSAFVRDAYVERALELEVEGYLCKCTPLAEIVEAIAAVAAGGRRFSESVTARITVGGGGATVRTSRGASLTDRERLILEQIALGLPQKQIAGSLGISIKTVQHHLAHVMDKLGLHDRVDLARYAIREGLVEP